MANADETLPLQAPDAESPVNADKPSTEASLTVAGSSDVASTTKKAAASTKVLSAAAKKEKRKREKNLPLILQELGMTRTKKGNLRLPESRKERLKRKREERHLALGDAAPNSTGPRKQLQELDGPDADLFRAAMCGDGPGCRSAILAGGNANRVLKKADLDGVGTGGCPLHVAALRGHDTVASVLLAHNADPNATTGRSETPIHLASRNGHVGVVKLLIAHGASSTLADKQGVLPIDRVPAWDDRKRRQLQHALAFGQNSGKGNRGLPPPPPRPPAPAASLGGSVAVKEEDSEAADAVGNGLLEMVT